MHLQLPEYSLQEVLSEGRTTVVCRGERRVDGVRVVLKLPCREHPEPAVNLRLRHEFAVLRTLDAPSVVRALDLVEDVDAVALVLEEVPWPTLARLTHEHRLELATALEMVVGLVEAIRHIHRRGVLHRDIKPQNILVEPDSWRIKLIDFGCASRVGEGEDPAAVGLHGTLEYIAPEQTGRTAHPADQRADLYSIGITLYELLTGSLPFASSDPNELVHGHLALRPTPPVERAPTLPVVMSDLVMKLLAKNPEDRYQSAGGLLADLRECLRRLLVTGRVEPFELGRHEEVRTLRPSSRLYGRDAELARLIDEFEQARAGAARVLLVSGYSGVGKSAFVSQLQVVAAERGGRFIAGKFEQFGRAVPYAALGQALGRLFRQILAESEQSLAAWRQRLLGALGINGRLITDLVPELQRVIGRQPAVIDLGPTEAQNRLMLVFRRLLRLFAGPEHPLALFLDDLQWTDPASLHVLQMVLIDPDCRGLLVVGGYRDGEVGEGHPLKAWVNELRARGVTCRDMHLRPLTSAVAAEYVADALGTSSAEVGPLAELVYDRTEGNPFFMGQFLGAVHRAGLLAFDGERQAWHWDLAGIERAVATDNVVDLMIKKLKRLAPATRRLLELAACIGSEFDEHMLAAIGEASQQSVAFELWEAVREGLLVPLEGEAPATASRYRFLHDRVQQAAYSLIDRDERQATHLRIGRLMLAVGVEPREEVLFDIVNHINMGMTAVGRVDRVRYALLNLRAGRRARGASAYTAAAGYLASGAAWLGEHGWSTDYDLCFATSVERAECEYLAGNLAVAEELFSELLGRARSDHERVQVYTSRVALYYGLGRFADSLGSGLAGLALLGVTIPESDAARAQALDDELAAVAANLGDRSIRGLAELPEMSDSRSSQILRLLVNLNVPAYFVSPVLFALVIVMQVNLSLRGGNSRFSPFIYVTYGYFLAGRLGRYREGVEFGQLALALLDRQPGSEQTCKVNYAYAAFAHFCEPLRGTLQYYRTAYPAGLESGDLVYASYAAIHVVIARLALGDELAAVRLELAEFLKLMQRTGDAMSIAFLRVEEQLIARLTEGAPGDDAALATSLHEPEYAVVACRYYIVQLQLHYLFGDVVRALECAALAEANIGSAMGHYYSTELPFYASLALVQAGAEAPADERPQLAARLARQRAQLVVWAASCPENHRHKLTLVDAEIARVEGRNGEARELYDLACDEAKAAGFQNHLALAHELAAAFYSRLERTKYARLHAVEARHWYARWGADAMVRALDLRYAELLRTPVAHSVASAASAASASSASSTFASASVLDADSVLKAAHAFITEVELDKLLAKVMSLLVENAGAERGVLALELDGSLRVVADLRAGAQTCLDQRPLADYPELPVAIVHSVFRLAAPVVLADAAEDHAYADDPYVAAHRTRSLLCIPVVHQGRARGVLYAENNLLAGAFAPERLAVLRMLTAQLAVSIEHALLFSRLEDAVRSAQAARVSAEAASRTKSTFLLNMSHELRTPLNAIIGYSEMLQEAAEDGELDDPIPDLHNIQRAAKHLLGILSDILDLARIEAGRIEVRLAPFVIEELVGDVVVGVTPELDRNGNTIEVRLGPDLGGMVSDASKVRQILFNLLRNATTFTHQGKITVSVARSADPGGDRVRFDVADTGIGIAPEHHERIFAAFTQADNSATRRHDGAGLGLTICRQLCRALGGDVTVASALGAGSTFSVVLPASS